MATGTGTHDARPRSTSRAVIAAVFLFAAAVSTLAVHLSLMDYVPDDVYIHLRIARNLAENGQPFFNLGEAVKGSSSTLWTLILAAVFRSVGVAIWPVAILNSFLVVGAGIVYGVLTSIAFPGRRLLRWASGSLVAVALLPTSVSLMESTLAVFLIGVAWIMLMRKNSAGFAVGALAVFARPEMAVFVAGAVIVGLATSSFRLGKIVVAGGLAALPFLIFDLAFFQTVIPNAAVAKSIVFPLTAIESLGVTRFPLSTVFAGPYLVLGLLAVVVLWLTPMGASTSLNKWLLVSFTAAGSVIVLTYVAAGTFVFTWYQPLFVVPAVLSGVWISASTRRPISLLAAAALWIPSLWLFSVTVMDAMDHTRMLEPLHPSARVGQFRAVAEVLYNECPTCSLLAPEIGALGYQFEGHIVDAVGLVTPEALKYHPLAVPEERPSRFWGSIPPGIVSETRPDFIVSLSGFAEPLLRSPEASEYRLFSCPVAQPAGWNSDVAPSIFGMSELYVMVREDNETLGAAVLAGIQEFGCANRTEV